jgi:hypothetical protein
MDLTVVAYATLALSLLVSAVKMGGWILSADPRAIINAGRWTLAALPALALGLLVWLLASGRWTAAMLLGAFLLPLAVQAAPRWRLLFSPFVGMKSGFGPFAADLGGSIVPRDRPAARQQPDPELVECSIAVLRSYLEHTRPRLPEQEPRQLEHRPAEGCPNPTEVNGAGNTPLRMSTREAFDILGLAPTPSPREVKEAHRRLAQLLDPQLGGSHYLLAKIDEARDVLLGD